MTMQYARKTLRKTLKDNGSKGCCLILSQYHSAIFRKIIPENRMLPDQIKEDIFVSQSNFYLKASECVISD
jgi:hypothetical protein